jgi:hypothetical protein
MWNCAWIAAVLVILTTGFATYDSTRWGLFFSLGAGLFALLAILPPRKRSGEAWVCLAAIVSCGLFGAYRFRAEVATISPRDRFDFLRLYVEFGILTGIAIVLPYVVLRLLRLRWRSWTGTPISRIHAANDATNSAGRCPDLKLPPRGQVPLE